MPGQLPCHFQNRLIADRNDDQIHSCRVQIFPTIDALGINFSRQLKRFVQLATVDLPDVQAARVKPFCEVPGHFAGTDD